MRSLVVPLAMPILRFATRSYITGPALADAFAIVETAAGRGYRATICYWNEGGEDPDAVARRYHAILDGAADARAGGSLDVDLAVKIPALWNRPDLVAGVVGEARALGRRAVFDSHTPGDADVVLETIERLGAPGLGCAIPGRWRRSRADAERAVAAGAHVRVVKGQWPDPGAPDIDLASGFMTVVDALAGRAPSVGVATHDPVLARRAIETLRAAGTPCELELLYGLPLQRATSVAAELGVPVRLYVPFGTAWLPYSVSRALSNPRVVLWLARDLIRRRDPLHGADGTAGLTRRDRPPGAAASP